MLDIWLIRHGQTYGNTQKRYIGVTDEPLCQQGREQLKNRKYPANPDAVFVSPLRRCVETARILFPDNRLYMMEDLEECDFGEFENKNYLELSGNFKYQEWIDSNGTLPFPGGESREEFQRRSLRGFLKAADRCIRTGKTNAALVIHGGTIRNILEEYGVPHRSFYEWQIENGEGYLVQLDPALWMQGKKELRVCKKEGETYETAMDEK